MQIRAEQMVGRPYRKNTVMRKQAVHDFEKLFCNLMSNACFGKTVEILRKRLKVTFVSNPQQAETFTQRATLKFFQFIEQILVSVFFKNSSVVWTKATPVATAVLDLSKLSIHKFQYKKMVPRSSSDQLKVAYKDTDSLLYQIQTPDLYKDMASFMHLLDLSDYPKDHYLYHPSNKKLPLTMTDELQGKILREVFCLRSKLHSIDYVGGKKQSAKGAQKSVKIQLNHDLLRQSLFSKEKVLKTLTQLRLLCHQIVMNEIDKVAMSSFDVKGFLPENGVSCLAYGHHKMGAISFETTDQQRGLLIFLGCY